MGEFGASAGESASDAVVQLGCVLGWIVILIIRVFRK